MSRSPSTFLETPKVPVNCRTVLVTVNVGEVPSPMTIEAVPSGFTSTPSPDHTMSLHCTSGGVPDGVTSESVTTVPVASCSG